MFSLKNLVTALLLQASASIASPIAEVQKRASGFQNTVYFTNWLALLVLFLHNIN